MFSKLIQVSDLRYCSKTLVQSKLVWHILDGVQLRGLDSKTGGFTSAKLTQLTDFASLNTYYFQDYYQNLVFSVLRLSSPVNS